MDFLWFQPIAVLFPIVLVSFFLSRILRTNNSASTKRFSPSPPKLPIIGNLHQLGKYPHRSLESLSRKYGDLMLLHLGNKPTLVVSSASATQQIMKTHDLIFSNRPHLSMPDRLLYNGKDVGFAPYGEYWKQMRSVVVLQLLSSKRVQSFRAIRREEVALMMEKIGRLIPFPMNLSKLLITLTNDMVCRVAFGRKYSGEEDDAANFQEILRRYSELLGTFYFGDYIPRLAWIQRVNGFDAKVSRVAKDFDRLLEGILEEHMDRQNKQKNDDKKGDMAKDFVDVLLEIQTDNTVGFQIDRDSIKAQILDVFGAGTNTTYAVLEWAMTELLMHPKIMKKLQKEVRGVVGSKAEVTEDDLEKMNYLRAVIKETLRLHPPGPLLVPHESTEDVKINDYDIVAGTRVIVNAWAIQRDPASWEAPNEFYPDRFLNSIIDFKGQDFQLIPFGAGRRGCPGLLFAMVIDELILANILHKFDWSLPTGDGGKALDMSESIGIVTHRKTPLIARASLASSSV
ncbi:hypothetical protein Nepgr_023352 [Nepenthes gracilis]|uniref:Cytochrome P450 n=1 Tax=Nepenthes gracilis TaxID=150966 RepID=A0AAD3XZ11_NEPGR|nr:hypothetical protein Nepgr_023352 [Nepenthes gracilis]